ncbi:hypothetical protein BDY19DRAFT_1064761 [Irpex rosettiformis]|uniref:Uncharacterized protein n=1 Tax=Irpex rosettiformis TaxID=378272 RepID=A0ACB8UGF3_9APHY|nr:hypothetical protein BDY19DRAFT_1064761 [Irpex rosettiformis]
MASDASPSTPPPTNNPSENYDTRASPIAHHITPCFSGLGQLEGSRTALLKDLGPAVKQVQYEYFQNSVLPRLPPEITVKKVLGRLLRLNKISDGRWNAFPRDPCQHAKKSSRTSGGDEEWLDEKGVFANLYSVVDAIEECASNNKRKKRSTTTSYESMPDSTPMCCFDKSTGKPDAYFVLKDRFLSDRPDGRRYWRDLATPGEFKLRDTLDDLQDDIKKTCWNMYKIMVGDPRRRSVFAFTIENTTMRVWMGNRSEVIVTEPFNFITDHRKVVHFFLSQLYGSEVDLGIGSGDMTIISAEEQEIPRYRIKVRQVVNPSRRRLVVEELVYHTTRLISDDGAKSFRGSGTRVWEVVQVVDGVERTDTPLALKDHWVDDSRQCEGNIIQEILGDPGISDKQRRALTALLLAPVARGDVYILDEFDGKEKLDDTRTLSTRGADIPENATVFSLKPGDKLPATAKSGGKGGNRGAREKDTVVIYESKRHHRAVFAQVLEPLSKETSLHRVFSALYSVTFGLLFMHDCGPGWVHRDISTGNILLFPGKNIAKLSDLEYAKRLDDVTKHAIRTGTMNFIAVEVDKGMYMFTEDPKAKDEAEIDMDDMADEIEGFLASAGVIPSTSVDEEISSLEFADEEPFFYNPLHDLESIWWIAVYFVVNKKTALAHRKRSAVGSDHQDIVYADLTEEQLKFARNLFYWEPARHGALNNSGITPLDKHLFSLPSYLKPICSELIKLRKTMVKHYRDIEKPGFVIDKTVCLSIYPLFTKAFKTIMGSLAKRDILVAPLEYDPREELLKDAYRTHGPSARVSKRPKLDLKAASTSSAANPAKTKCKALVVAASTRKTRSATSRKGKGKAVAKPSGT